MEPVDRPRFAAVLNLLASVYHREVTTLLLDGYWLALDDLPIGSVERGAASAMRECKFMPTPVELRELAGELRAADRAVLAWSAFERAVSAIGAYRSVDFDDPLANATVRHLGGWERVCGLTVSEFDTWLRKDFLRAYETFCRTGVSPEAAAPLVGIHQKENRLLGHDDPATARLVPACAGPPLRIATGLGERRFGEASGRPLASPVLPRLELRRPMTDPVNHPPPI